MSTRANVIIKSGDEKLYFYRHHDGYPKGVETTLNIFTKWLREDKIRNHISRCAGWLILLGALEYNTILEYDNTYDYFGHEIPDTHSVKPPSNWKVGSYEPTTMIHGDIEHLYVIDLDDREWKEIPENEWDYYDENTES